LGEHSSLNPSQSKETLLVTICGQTMRNLIFKKRKNEFDMMYFTRQ